jgi:hypothetical protein
MGSFACMSRCATLIFPDRFIPILKLARLNLLDDEALAVAIINYGGYVPESCSFLGPFIVFAGQLSFLNWPLPPKRDAVV